METSFFAIGDHRVTVGIFAEAIVSQPGLTRNGTFLLEQVDVLSANDYIRLWGKVTGNEEEVVQPSVEDLDEVFPTCGLEIGLILE
jgi:hypothetical protein